MSNYQKEYYSENKQTLDEEHREYYRQNREKVLAKQREYRQKTSGKQKERHSLYYQEVANKKYRDLYWKLRQEVIKRLGKKCLKCGMDDFRCLQIDHIKNNGYEERQNVYWRTYYNSILKMSDEELKSSYQLLCANCNWIRKYDNGF